MANISDYLYTAKELIHNAIKAISGEHANKDNDKEFLSNLDIVDPIIPNEFIENQSGKMVDKTQDD